MNQYKEAFEYIKNYCELDDDCVKWPLYQRSIKSLKELVNKVTPKKPLKNRYDYLICPICTNEIENERGHVFKYCPKCGQALDWSE